MRPFFGVLFFRKLSKDFSFPGVRRSGSDLGWVLEVVDLAVEYVVLEGDDLTADELVLEGDDRAFARLRAADVVSVRSK